VSVFQNWLRGAGASLDHLHKQLVALDEWGASITGQIRMLREDPNVYNEFGANFAAHHNLVFAENDFAIAYAGIGHRFPTIEIYSRSRAGRPYEHTDEEIRGMSDLVRAIHAAMGNQISCNEEWYYTPIDAVYKMPWHVLIKWRINVTAGFEGGTSIFINPMTPIELRDRMVPGLYHLRDEGKVSWLRIAEECRVDPNPLKYYLK
jgi:galactose-1-phosphate uridylyltransferase